MPNRSELYDYTIMAEGELSRIESALLICADEEKYALLLRWKECKELIRELNDCLMVMRRVQYYERNEF